MEDIIKEILDTTTGKVIVVIMIMAIIGSLIPDDHSNECIKTGCTSKKAAGSSYCYTHKSVSSSLSSSSSSKSSSSTKAKSSSSSTHKSTTRKSSTVKMPDCDDYDSYDDFMDDWDGCMPDGSDAEDYWENW